MQSLLNHGLDSDNGELLHDPSAQRLGDKLIYLTIGQLDISYAVSIARQFMHAPWTRHLAVVHWILRYLKWSLG